MGLYWRTVAWKESVYVVKVEELQQSKHTPVTFTQVANITIYETKINHTP